MDDAIKQELQALSEPEQRSVLKSYLFRMISDYYSRDLPALTESSRRAREIRALFNFTTEEVIAIEQDIEAELRKEFAAIPSNRRAALE